jgi:glutamate-5-semialdehyde dehydrogenase
MSEVQDKGRAAKEAAKSLSSLPTAQKDLALVAIAKALRAGTSRILAANAQDLAAASALPKSVTKRLELDGKKVESMAAGFDVIGKFPDPVGSKVESWTLDNGLSISRIRVPLGVLAFIYEARPNVTCEATSLALKSGNAIVLRGGKEAIATNTMLVTIMREALASTFVPADAVQLITDTSHEAAAELMALRECIDVLIPRGGAGLIRAVVEKAKVPVIETGAGNCHAYVDESADLQTAERIILNAKLSSPYVCNALEHVLVHRAIADAFIPRLASALSAKGVEVRVHENAARLLPNAKKMTEQELYQEYLDLIIGIQIVDNVEQAAAHINQYGTHHSDAIIADIGANGPTEAQPSAKAPTRAGASAAQGPSTMSSPPTRAIGSSTAAHAIAHFTQTVDSACVYVNASTRFTDGFTMGFGGEVGISTQRLHARGPIGLKELCTTKLVILGNGQIRE